MDPIEKALRNMSEKQQAVFKSLLLRIDTGRFEGMDLKKLKGRQEIYRVRKGKFRIIFRIKKDDSVMILALERRSDTTY